MASLNFCYFHMRLAFSDCYCTQKVKRWSAKNVFPYHPRLQTFSSSTMRRSRSPQGKKRRLQRFLSQEGDSRSWHRVDVQLVLFLKYCSMWYHCYATLARRNLRCLVTVGKHIPAETISGLLLGNRPSQQYKDCCRWCFLLGSPQGYIVRIPDQLSAVQLSEVK
jgi:hypothetical protein